MAQASAPVTDGEAVPRIAAALGPASACAAAVTVALGYLPNLNSVFTEPKLALLYLAGALGFAAQIAGWVFDLPARARLSRSLAGAVAALVVTTAIAALAAVARGAPGAPYACVEIARLLAVVGVALSAARAAVEPIWRRRLLASIHVAGGLVSLIGLLQHLQILPLQIPTISVPGSTFGNRNIAAEAVALSIPFGLAWLVLVWPRAAGSGKGTEPNGTPRDAPGPIVLMLALELVYLGATRTRGAWLGAASGIVVFYGLRRRALPRAALGVAMALAMAAFAAAVIPGRVIPRDVADSKRFEPGEHVVREALDPTSPVVRARLGLWRRTLAMYRAHPLLGVGPGNFVVFFPLYAEPGARADGVLTPTVVPRRAHEDLLERLAETGPFGLLALLAVYGVGAALAVARSRRADAGAAGEGERHEGATIAAAAAGALAALFACGLTGFPLAMPATMLLFGVALGFLACEGRLTPRRAAPSPSRARALHRVAAILAATVIVVGATVGSVRAVMRSYWLARERTALRTPDRPGSGPQAALEALRRAEQVSPGSFEVALETAYVLVRLRRFGEARAPVDRALAIEPYSATAWLMRAEAELAGGDPRAAVEDTNRALGILSDYPDALTTRALAEARLGDTRAVRETRDHLARLAASGDQRARQLLDGLPSETGLR